MSRLIRRVFAALLLGCVVLAQTGCAGAVESWIVRTRDNQGDRALRQGNLKEAALAYRLALEVNPQDPHARTGSVSVRLALAEIAYRNGKLEDALSELAVAEKIDPKNPNVVDLREQLSEARLKREIVLSNYPTYKATGQELIRAYAQLKAADQEIINGLKRFGYSYDTTDLSKAIEGSYELAGELSRNTARLAAFRQAVESGYGAQTPNVTLGAPASLLPLP
jgi:tetratricopeptide (TPR) repeat protein